MSSTSKSAVSDYEHLKYRFGDENQIWLNESDDDFLPLKSKNRNVGNHQEGVSDTNQNNFMAPSSGDVSENGFHLIDKVPVPSAWSPGMMSKPNPLLFITPEKTSKSLEKDNILEPRDLNKVPAPTAWIPHPELRPTVFVTPEKAFVKEPSSFKRASTDHTSAIQITDTSKSKEKLTVRFDLPSSSSGDELYDISAISDPGSPITIHGKDFPECENDFVKSKVYNPVIYSDESVLDDSLPLDKGTRDNNSVSLSTSANLVEKLNQLLLSSQVHDSQKVSTQSAASNSACHKTSSSTHHKESLTSTQHKQSSSALMSSRQSSIDKVASSNGNVQNSSSIVLENKSSRSHSHSVTTKEAKSKSGPHHLNSSVSPYYPPYSGACVVREAKHPMVSTDYSYPFQDTNDNQKHEHIFSRPEFNSTLKVRSELDNLCDLDVDVEKAVDVKLSKSITKRTEIHEKAAAFTNQLSYQFNNLVDLEPAVDRLCDRVVRTRTSKTTSQKKGSKQQKKSSDLKEPDLMEFYHSDLQKESPDLGLLGICPVTPDLMAAPHSLAFDCYRHNRVWNGLRDF